MKTVNLNCYETACDIAADLTRPDLLRHQRERQKVLQTERQAKAVYVMLRFLGFIMLAFLAYSLATGMVGR